MLNAGNINDVLLHLLAQLIPIVAIAIVVGFIVYGGLFYLNVFNVQN